MLRLEHLASDLDSLKTRLGWYGADGPSKRESCPLTTERSATEKAIAVPRAPSLRALLAEEPALLQSVCNIYMQDFVCLGYPLPDGCELLPPTAARPPPTMNITPAALFGRTRPRQARRAGRPRRPRRRARHREDGDGS